MPGLEHDEEGASGGGGQQSHALRHGCVHKQEPPSLASNPHSMGGRLLIDWWSERFILGMGVSLEIAQLTTYTLEYILIVPTCLLESRLVSLLSNWNSPV
jgi:hypothetical protein